MNLRLTLPGKVATLGIALLIVTGCGDENAATHEDIIRKDLSEILSHQGSRCENVQSFEIDERFDYLVRCDNGTTYRIHVGAEGHVKVNEHSDEASQ